MEKNKKKTQVVKEQPIIKDSDYENDNDTKKIIIVALILALLIGGFAYVRSLEDKKDKKKDQKTEEVVKKPSPVVEEEDNNTEDKYVPSTTVAQEVVDVWASLKEVPTTLEAGVNFALPVIKDNDNGKEVVATVTYKYRANKDAEYVTVGEFDTTKIGEYLITYTLSYLDGKVEVREILVVIEDTMEPIINNIVDGQFFNEDVILDITEYSPYIVELNGVVYDEKEPITQEGEYTLTVMEDKEDGKGITVTFVIDKTAPSILGVVDNQTYNHEVVIESVDENLDIVFILKDGEIIDFENGITLISQDGIYEVVAIDKAGNITDYVFTIDASLPIVVTYTPDNMELTNDKVLVTISSNKRLQEVSGWELSSDGMILTKEYSENKTEEVIVTDIDGNQTVVTVVVDYINYNVCYSPKLTLENLVANKVKATITSLKQLIIDESWVEIVENDLYKYEKIYDANTTEVVTYEDVEGNIGSINIDINIEFNDLLVSYDQDGITQNVKAYVTTEEEVALLPEGWEIDTEYLGDGYRYYHEYTENVSYEIVEFVTESKTYVATIMIDSIDRDAPNAEVDVNYVTENDEKKSVEIVVTADEQIEEVFGWDLSLDKKSLTKKEDRPEVVPSEEQNGEVTITDLAGNETVVKYTYDWN